MALFPPFVRCLGLDFIFDVEEVDANDKPEEDDDDDEETKEAPTDAFRLFFKPLLSLNSTSHAGRIWIGSGSGSFVSGGNNDEVLSFMFLPASIPTSPVLGAVVVVKEVVVVAVAPVAPVVPAAADADNDANGDDAVDNDAVVVADAGDDEETILGGGISNILPLSILSKTSSNHGAPNNFIGFLNLQCVRLLHCCAAFCSKLLESDFLDVCVYSVPLTNEQSTSGRDTVPYLAALRLALGSEIVCLSQK